MTAIPSLQIAIIGGGPAGVATALHIARRLPTVVPEMIVFEAAAHPRPKICGGGVTFHGEEQLRRLELRLDVPSVSVHRLAFQLGEQIFAATCQSALRIVQRASFDAALAQAAVERNIIVQGNEKLLDLTPTENGVLLTTDRGRYHARIVVAADGANSTVRQKLGMRSQMGVARLLRVVQPAEATTSSSWTTGTAHFDFSCIPQGIQGYMWDFPSSINGQQYVNLGIFDSRIQGPTEPRAPRGQLKKAFAAYLRKRNLDVDSVTLQGHPVRWFNPEAEFSRPHILLAGDSAGVDSLFAEGISYALEYGSVVAETIADAFAREDFSFRDYRQRLLNTRLSRSLRRRRIVARHLYRFRYPWLWFALWRAAGVAPASVNQTVGAALDVLPPISYNHWTHQTPDQGASTKDAHREMAIRSGVPDL